MPARFGIKGGRELADAFRQLGKAPTPAARARAREKALEPVKEAAGRYLELNNSVITGALKASLTIAQDPGRTNRTILGQTKGMVKGYFPVSYAHLVEFSVAPHYQPRRFGGIMHPGHPGYPFMRPAAEEASMTAGRVYLAALQETILQAAARAKKAPRR